MIFRGYGIISGLLKKHKNVRQNIEVVEIEIKVNEKHKISVILLVYLVYDLCYQIIVELVEKNERVIHIVI